MTDYLSVAKDDLSLPFANEALASKLVAWDIETTGLDFKRDLIGTCQLHIPGVGTEIVQLSPGVLPDRLVALLESDRVLKLFHHAPFDLRFMSRQWSTQVRHVACTKITAKIADPGLDPRSYSLKPLLAKYLGVEISKDQQVSNWTRPNLTESQVRYAADDVRHLPALFGALMYRAQMRGVQDLVFSSFNYIPTRVATDLLGAGDVFAH